MCAVIKMNITGVIQYEYMFNLYSLFRRSNIYLSNNYLSNNITLKL